MLKHLFIYSLMALCFHSAYSQNLFSRPPAGPDVCAIQIGGNYYINMEHILIYRGTDVCDIKSRHDSIVVNLTIFDAYGKVKARVVNSGVPEKYQENVTVKYSNESFTLTDAASRHVICHIKKSAEQYRNRCLLLVWLDAFLPNGFYLNCNPDSTNSPSMQNIKMQDALFENGYAALEIN